MSSQPGVTIRLQGLPVTASSADIRKFFYGLSIPDGGVHIIGGDNGEAFISFSSDEDGRRGMLRNNGDLSGSTIRLFLSSKHEMQSVIDKLRGATAGSAPAPPPAATAPFQPPGSFHGYYSNPAAAAAAAANQQQQQQQPFSAPGQYQQSQVQQFQDPAYAPQSFPPNSGSFSSPAASNFPPFDGAAGYNQQAAVPNSGLVMDYQQQQNPQQPLSNQYNPLQPQMQPPSWNQAAAPFGHNAPDGSKPGQAQATSSDIRPAGVSERGDTDFFRGPQSFGSQQQQPSQTSSDSFGPPIRGRGEHHGPDYSPRGRGSFRGRSDFAHQRGDFSSRGRGNFALGRGDSSAPRGRGDFTSRGGDPAGRGNFVMRGRGDFSQRGRGDFAGRGDFHGRGDDDSSSPGGNDFPGSAYPSRGSFSRGRGELSGRGRGDFPADSGRGRGEFMGRGRGDFFRGRGDFSRGRGADFGHRGRGDFHQHGGFPSARDSAPDSGPDARNAGAPVPPRQPMSDHSHHSYHPDSAPERSNPQHQSAPFRPPGASQHAPAPRDLGNDSRRFDPIPASGVPTRPPSDTRAEFPPTQSVPAMRPVQGRFSPPRGSDHRPANVPHSPRDVPIPYPDPSADRRPPPTRDVPSARPWDKPNDRVSLPDSKRMPSDLAPREPFRDDRPSAPIRPFNDRKRSGSREHLEGLKKRPLLENPPSMRRPMNASYCVVDNAPLNTTALDVKDFLSKRGCHTILKPIIVARQNYCLVYLKFGDRFEADKCCELDGSSMRSTRVRVTTVSENDFNQAYVEFQTQVNKEIYLRCRSKNYRGLFLELGGLPKDVTGEDVSEMIGGIPLQVEDLYVEYNPRKEYSRWPASGFTGYIRLIGQPDVNMALRYDGEKWNGNTISVKSISSDSHWRKIKEHYQTFYESANHHRSRSKPNEEPRPSSSGGSRKRPSPPASSDSKKAKTEKSSSRHKSPPAKGKQCPENVCVEMQNLPDATEKRDVREFFRKMKVMHVVFAPNDNTKAYVEFEKEREQIAALRMNNSKMKDKEIKILAIDSKDYLKVYEECRSSASNNKESDGKGDSKSENRVAPSKSDAPSRPMATIAPTTVSASKTSDASSSSAKPSTAPPPLRPTQAQGSVATGCYELKFARPTRVNTEFLKKFLQVSPSTEMRLNFSDPSLGLCDRVLFRSTDKSPEHFSSRSGKAFVGIIITLKAIDQLQYDSLVGSLVRKTESPPVAKTPENKTAPKIPESKRRHYCVTLNKGVSFKTADLRKFLRMREEPILTAKPVSVNERETFREVYVSTEEYPHQNLMSFNRRWFLQAQLEVKQISESDYEIEIAVISKMNSPPQKPMTPPKAVAEPLDKCMVKLSQLPPGVTEDQISDFFKSVSIREKGICILGEKQEAIVFFTTSADREKALKKHTTLMGSTTVRVENCYLTEAMTRVPSDRFNSIALVGFPPLTEEHLVCMAENIPKDCNAKQLSDLFKPIKIEGITFLRSCSIAFVVLHRSIDVQLSQLKSNNFIGSHKVKLTPKTKEDMRKFIEDFKRENEIPQTPNAPPNSKSSPVTQKTPFQPINPKPVTTQPDAVLLSNLPNTVIKKDIVEFFQDSSISLTESRVLLRVTSDVAEALVLLENSEQVKVAADHNQSYLGPKRVAVKALSRDEVSRQLSLFGASVSPSIAGSSSEGSSSTGFDPITLRISGLPIDVKEAEILQFFREFEPNPSYLTLSSDPITRACSAQLMFDNRTNGLAAMNQRHNKFLGGRKIVITTL